MPYNLLKGKKGIIFGALDEKSIAWKTALACHAEGAEILLTNAPIAMRMGEINKLTVIFYVVTLLLILFYQIH